MFARLEISRNAQQPIPSVKNAAYSGPSAAGGRKRGNEDAKDGRAIDRNAVPVNAATAEDIQAILSRFSNRPVVRIQLLGPMRATTYLGDNILPRGKRARAVLGYLCLARDEPVARSRLAALLWDRVPDAAAQANLRNALREISSAFAALADELIVIDRETVRLNAGACWVDALAAMALDPAAPEMPPGDLQVLCRGDLLESLDGASASFDRWLLRERTRLAERLELLFEREPARTPHKKESSAVGFNRARADSGDRARTPRQTARRREARQETLQAVPVHESEDPVGSRAASAASQQHRPSEAVEPGRDRLRVGVLPFVADTRKEESLGLSLSQEVAAALARFRWFDVIAPMSLRPTSSMPFVDRHQLQRIADYVVEGKVSSGIDTIRINVRLLELDERARPVWSECFELAHGELHRLNELITTRIVAQIDPVILFIEGQPRRREHYGATGLLLLAIPLIYSMERKKYEEAGQLIRRALELEPNNSMVAAWSAHWHCFYAGQRWTDDFSRIYAITREHALRAIKLDPENAEALGIYAHICSIVDKDFDSALHYFDRSLRLNPSLAFVWAFSALTHCYIGDPETALQRLDRYRELAPFDPYYFWFQHLYAIAYTFKGDYEQAVAVGRRATSVNPEFVAGYKPLIAALGHLGRRDEARPYIAKLLSLEPNFTVENFGQVYPFKKAADRRRYMRGLLLAGVPER
jgi:TolB-like protein